MYHIPYFKASGDEDVIAFMHAHPFILLCGTDAGGKPVATHIPVLVEERDSKIFLLGHTMRKQQHTNAFDIHPDVLAVFHGPHTYVSAGWYENKQTAGTWNYQAVHAKGVLSFKDDKALFDLLVKLTEQFENNPHSPALVQQMDEAYVTSMMKAIVAFEIEVTSLQHVFKLSQNRDEKSYENIISHLDSADADGRYIADEMKKNKQHVFPAK